MARSGTQRIAVTNALIFLRSHVATSRVRAAVR